jgi:hypothetical protein
VTMRESLTLVRSLQPASMQAMLKNWPVHRPEGNQAIAADTANSANPISPRGSAAPRVNAANLNLVSMIVEQLEILAISESRTAQQLLPICDPGTADLDQNNNGTEGTIQFTNCLVTGGNGAVVNGKVEFDSTISGSTITSLNMRFINFRVTHLGATQTVYMTVSCSGAPLACNLFSDYVGVDGRIYRVEITVVTNTAATSFDVDATVFDPDHGFFTINASVTYNNCPGSVPETGAITITGDAATTASVVFNDCDSFTVTHLGVPTVYMWADIL